MDFENALHGFSEMAPRITELILDMGEKKGRLSDEEADTVLEPLMEEYERLSDDLAELEEPFLNNFAVLIMGQMFGCFDEFDKKRDAFLVKHPFPGGKKYEKAQNDLVELYKEAIEEFQVLRLVSLNPFCDRHGLNSEDELKKFINNRQKEIKLDDLFYAPEP